MKDVFGRDVKVGDKIAAGMNYNRSSVLRIGEVVKVTEKSTMRGYAEHRHEVKKWTVRVRWTHNGSERPDGYGEVQESSILGDESYSYAKFVILPKGFVDQFPPDIA